MTHLLHLPAVPFDDGSVFEVDLFTGGAGESEDENTFAALILVVSGEHCIAVYSPRRREWSMPGGWLEADEGAREAAVRELAEETGLIVPPGDLEACGHETYTSMRLARNDGQSRWPENGGTLQLFRVEIAGRPTLAAALDDAVDPRWVTLDEFRELSGTRFWWPMVEATFGG